eukprot:CAMPEP_0117537124 /NCGR_PEP_ID=MMETSP0784-20121206/41804_1 /TAXON_ID=39447 /ORGANISM="" /LENGTH=114 /DNA_ID=CAMNT_0005333703 /DNA_START=163 /DNA_END=503 /DNA_ORIENTATION=+
MESGRQSDNAKNNELGKYLKSQAARWKSSVVEAEELLDQCMSCSDRLAELAARCKLAAVGETPSTRKSTEAEDEGDMLQESQEAIIRMRLEAQAATGEAHENSRSLKKTVSDRR